MKTRYAFVSVLGLIAIGGRQASGFSFTTLDPPGSSFTIAGGVSGATVVGAFTEPQGSHFNHHGFIYNGSTYTTVDVPGATYTELDGISAGTIAGTYYGPSGGNHGFIYNGTTFTTLDVPGATSTVVNDISGGTVVGSYGTAAGPIHGYIYDGSTYTTLDVPGAHQGPNQGTFIFGISGGNVVGYYTSNTFYPESVTYENRGFIYDGSTFTTLNFPGANSTRALAVSGGNVVGDYDGHGFIYDGSTFTTLDSPQGGNTTPLGISGNRVVGFYFDQSTVHGFIAQVSEPGDFNNDGTVDAADYIAWRKNGGTPAAFDTWRMNFSTSLVVGSGSALPSAAPLSAAVPEPGTLALMGMSAFAFIARCRRHSRIDQIRLSRLLH
jgi:hypothetical protein